MRMQLSKILTMICATWLGALSPVLGSETQPHVHVYSDIVTEPFVAGTTRFLRLRYFEPVSDDPESLAGSPFVSGEIQELPDSPLYGSAELGWMSKAFRSHGVLVRGQISVRREAFESPFEAWALRTGIVGGSFWQPFGPRFYGESYFELFHVAREQYAPTLVGTAWLRSGYRALQTTNFAVDPLVGEVRSRRSTEIQIGGRDYLLATAGAKASVFDASMSKVASLQIARPWLLSPSGVANQELWVVFAMEVKF